MSVCKMKKLTVVVPRANADALMRRLMRLRAVSLTDATAGEAQSVISRMPGDESAAAERAARVDAVLPVLQKRSKRRFSLFPAPHQCSYAILFFTASDCTSITSHVHNWMLLLWLCLFILSRVISPLIPLSY